VTAPSAQRSPFIDTSNAMILLVDCQPGLSLAAESRSHQALVNNVVALARTAAVFEVPIIATTSATQRASGQMWPALREALTDPPMERHALNAYNDDDVRQAIRATGRDTVLIAGLLTEACVSFPALSMIGADYVPYIVADCCAGFNAETHELALGRASAVGVGLTSWIQLLLEWQGDWTHTRTYAGAVAILAEFGGAYGLELQHARDMLTSPAATPKN